MNGEFFGQKSEKQKSKGMQMKAILGNNQWGNPFARVSVAACMALVSHFAMAGIVITPWDGSGMSYTDPFDVSQGSTPLSWSGTASYSDGYSDIRSALGFSNPNSGPSETGTTYFDDGRPAGSIDWLNFKTASPVSISGFHLFTYDDSYSGASNGNRGFSRVTLSGSIDGNSFTQLATATLVNSYLAGYGAAAIELTGSFASVTDQYFVLSLEQYNTTGVRLVEFDAIQTPAAGSVPEPEMLALLGIGLAGLFAKRR